jgi:ADP-ribose pyrophosphatase YjhB (NUDIX family)
LIIENEKGEVLRVKRDKQPFIGLYNLPSGKIHEGESLIEAGMRELLEKTGITDEINLVPSGTVHLTVADGSDVISESYGFVLYAKLVDTDCSKGVYFDRKRTGGMYNLMPGVTEIISKASIGHKEVLTNTTL